MLNLIKDNRETIVLTAVITGMFIMAIAIGYEFRGGNPWAF